MTVNHLTTTCGRFHVGCGVSWLAEPLYSVSGLYNKNWKVECELSTARKKSWPASWYCSSLCLEEVKNLHQDSQVLVQLGKFLVMLFSYSSHLSCLWYVLQCINESLRKALMKTWRKIAMDCFAMKLLKSNAISTISVTASYEGVYGFVHFTVLSSYFCSEVSFKIQNS
jgi:hypothetical protein